ncbi:hypothetical protein [Ketogulonicigenium vulgare]|uniref:hypothetical protein n=1 Tax=Ketogulonicigenium vulgare TaxID=92945 RepID=UPI0023599A47|nr:hypothetical protein [Ketogulonicigenium vulgare]
MRDHAPTAQDPRTANEAQAPNPYNLAPERLRGEVMAAEAKQPLTAREVSTDRADVLQVAGELIGQRRDNRVEAMHYAGLTIRAMQKRIDELTNARDSLCMECYGHGRIIGWLCDEDCAACDGTGKAPTEQPPTPSVEEMAATVERMNAEITRLRTDRDAWEDRHRRDVYGLNNEGDPIGGNPPVGWKARAERAEAALAAAKKGDANETAITSAIKRLESQRPKGFIQCAINNGLLAGFRNVLNAQRVRRQMRRDAEWLSVHSKELLDWDIGDDNETAAAVRDIAMRLKGRYGLTIKGAEA